MSNSNTATPFILAVSGARIFTDYKQFETQMSQYLDLEHAGLFPSKMVSGGAYGTDTMAKKFAEARNISFTELKPEWKKHGRRAAILRNKDIVDAATHVIAFPMGVSSGTRHAIQYAKDKNKPIQIYEQDLPNSIPVAINNILNNKNQNELNTNSIQSSSQ
jgi:predicted Rossmann fold nucleotide-binding protein DprA/Smf involved in DNA uptake